MPHPLTRLLRLLPWLAASAATAQTPPPVVTRPLGVWWGGYRGSEQLVDAGANQWDFVRQHMDGFILHGAYWNQQTNTFGAPSPDVIGPKLAPLLAQFSKPVIVEHLLAGEYPDVESAFGTAFAGNVTDPAGYGSAIANIRRLTGYGFQRPDVSTDFIMETWREAVRFHPEWTSAEFFTALTGSWSTYPGTQFNPAPGSADRATYGWFRQWVHRLAEAFPGISVTATNSPVYLTWEENGDIRRELGGTLNNFHAWLKLERRGNLVSAFFSGDGSGWAPIGSATADLGASPVAGLHTASLNPARLAQARFTDVRAYPFFNADIGKTGRGGTASLSGSTLTLTGRGNDFIHPGNNTADALHFAYREWTGDGAVTVRIDSLAGSNPGRTNPAGETPTAGLMLRESLAPGSRQVSLLANLANQLELRSRAATNGSLLHASGSPFAGLGAASAPRWLRFTRTGSSIQAASSPDGTTWTVAGTVSVAFPSTVLVGVTADSEVRFETATAVFSSVSFIPAYTPAFSGTSIGSAGAGAGSSVASGTYTLKAAGTGLAGTADSVRFHGTAMPEGGTFVTRLSWFADDASPATALADGAQMGVSLRASTAADAPAVALSFTPRNGLQTLARATTGGAAASLATYGAGEVSIQPLNGNYRPLLHYFTGNGYLGGLHDAFPDSATPGHPDASFGGFTTDSPYAGYQRWGGSETHPDALRHREKIRLYERWLQDRGHLHDFIANSAGGTDFDGFNTATQAGRDGWDLLYKQHSMRSLQLHQIEGGRPDRVYLESWYEGPFTLVPETKDGSYANLVRDALLYVKGQGQTLSLSTRAPGSDTFSPGNAPVSSASAMGRPLVWTVRLQNTGTVPALPVLHAHGTGGTGWTATYALGGSDVGSVITSASGLAVTDAALYSGNELVAPGATVDLTVTLTPSAATERRRVLIRAFWNPQDPSLAHRAAVTLEAAPPSELLVNGDAESGGTDGWLSNGGGSVSLDTTVFRSGTGSIRGNRSQTYQGPAQNMLGRLIAGQVYRLTAWVRAASGTPSVKATLAYTGSSGPTIFSGLQTVTGSSTAWTPIDATFRYSEPNGTATALTLYFEGPPAGVALYVDDASLRRVDNDWTQTATGSHGFATGTNWSPTFAPVSSPHTALSFLTGRTALAGSVTANQNSAATLELNSLTLSGTAPASGSTTFTLSGNPLRLVSPDGRPLQLVLNASGPNLSYALTTPVSADEPIFVSGNGTAQFALNGSVSGATRIEKSGTSSLTLGGSNSFTGGVRHTAGSLILSSASSLGSGPVALAGGSFDATVPASTPGAVAIEANTTFTGDLTLNGPATLLGANRTLTVGPGTLTLAGPIDDDAPRNLVKSGAGALVLASPNSYRGTTTVTSGVLRISHPAALGTATAATIVQGGSALAALELTGGLEIDEPVQLVMHNTPGHTQLRNVASSNTLRSLLSLNSGGGRWDVASLAGHLTLSGGAANIVTGTDTWRVLNLHGPSSGTITGPLTDSATSKLNLNIVSGIWTLSGQSKAHTGTTTVSGGQLRVLAAMQSAVSVSAGGVISGTGPLAGDLTLATDAILFSSPASWGAAGPTLAANRVIGTGATRIVLRLDFAATTGAGETPAMFTLAQSTAGVIGIAPSILQVEVTGFTGTGTWAPIITANELGVSYTPDPYQAWSSGIPWAGRDPSTTADPDGDGRANLMEYALGTDPLSAAAPDVITVWIQDGLIHLSFPRLRADVLYEVLAAPAVAGPWTTLASNPGAVGASVTVSDTVVAGPGAPRFVHLRVTR